MHDPRDQHLTLVKQVLRHLKGTRHHGLQLAHSSTDRLIAYTNADWDRLIAYTNADWDGRPDTSRSTTGGKRAINPGL
jgi:hypothetical protein